MSLVTTTDARKRNTELTPQEHTMTSPTQRRHDEILGRLDALIDAVTPPTYTVETRTCRKAEPVDVTEEPPVGSQVTDRDGDVWERFADGWTVWDVDEWGTPGYRWVSLRRDIAPLRPTTDADRERVGLPVDTAPDEDPDEARDDPDAWRQVAKIMEQRAEDYAAEAKANNEVALSRLADVERLTRERDDLRGRVDELIRERGQAIEHYRALRTDVEAYGRDMPILLTSGERAVTGWLLARDDERGQTDA